MAEALEYPIRMEGEFPKDSLALIGARIDEGINRITRIDIEFVKTEGTFDLDDLVGTEVKLIVKMPGALERIFPATCVSAEYLGLTSGQEHFHAELRPWFWLLSRTSDSRVFQEMAVPDLFQQILGEYGFSDLDKRLTGTYPTREFLLQYRETDLDFLTRIAEEEGIYFFFDEKDGKDFLVLADNAGAHNAIPGDPKIPFRPRDDVNRMQLEHIHTWSGGRGAQSGRVTLNEYNFKKPKADMKVASALPKGKHATKDYELYDYPGKYQETSEGERYAKFRMEAEAIHHHTSRGAGTVPRLKVGYKFTLKDHPRKAENGEYLVTRLVHKLKLTDYSGEFLAGFDLSGIETGTSSQVSLEAVPAAEQYRPRAITRKPVIPGVQTAVVVGPAGDEIHTDQYGRIRIKFHWDREAAADDKASCWVRTMTPWSGNNWGMIFIPRIGQEVVVDFEEGDPDRPIVIGMLYNADTMPPYPLDSQKTRSGVKTNASKGGGGYHELVFEDKKGEEFVRFQSEKNYLQTVKNNARVDIGNDIVQSISNNKTEFVGNSRTDMVKFLKDVAVGLVYDEKVGGVKSQFVGIFKEEKVGIGKKDFSNFKDILRLAAATGGPASSLSDEMFETKFSAVGQALTYANAAISAASEPGKNEEIHGLSRLEVNGDREQLIQKGFSYMKGAKPGHFKTTVKDGNVDLKIEKGNYTVKVDMGQISVEAMKSIELKCGQSTIKMTPQDITIKSTCVKIDADMRIEAKAGISTEVSGDASLILKSATVMIN